MSLSDEYWEYHSKILEYQKNNPKEVKVIQWLDKVIRIVISIILLPLSLVVYLSDYCEKFFGLINSILVDAKLKYFISKVKP